MEFWTLYPFRFYDIVRRKWCRARYVATIEQLMERYDAFEIIGEPEIRPRGDPNELRKSGPL